jgi:hypothetical protein
LSAPAGVCLKLPTISSIMYIETSNWYDQCEFNINR